MEIYQALIIAAITGGISSVATVAAIKVDVRWVKQVQVEIKLQVATLEARVQDLERHSSL
ncbi:hypothetical protein ABVF78_004244 [Vibrio alginolyticus]|nr:hypothetical protein [Vibrio alginolyticus]